MEDNHITKFQHVHSESPAPLPTIINDEEAADGLNTGDKIDRATTSPQPQPHKINQQKQASAYTLYLFAIISTSLSAGLSYGWPSLRRTLVSEESSTLTEKQLGLIFTCGSWSSNAGRLLFGMARDHKLFGTRITACISFLAVTAGCMGIAFCDANSESALAFSLFLVGLGSGVQLCLQPVAGLFASKHQGSILASLSGAFQVSGLVFLALTWISMDRRLGFSVFCLILLGLLMCAVRLLPRRNFIAADADDDLNKDADKDKQEKDHNMRKSSAMHQMKSAEYIALLVWFSVQLVPLQYYIATIGFQLERKGDEDGTYTSLFSIFYASAAVFSPILGNIADQLGLASAQALATILSGGSLLLLAVNNIDLNVHLIGMTAYGIGRLMVFGMFFTNVGKRFGYTHYGTLAGVGLFISGLVSLVQYPLIALASDGYEQEVNVTSGCVMLLQGLLYCFWLGLREKQGSGNDDDDV